MRNGQIQNKNDMMLQVLCARLLIEMQFDISFQFYWCIKYKYIF